MLTLIKKVSENTTWDAIQKDVDEGKAGEYQIGTVLIETLKDGTQMPYVLAATNHYQQDELLFINMKNYGDHVMNKRATNKGGWNKSEMRRHANEDILALLPDDMAAVIAPRTIVEVENDGTRVESTDKLWGLSTMEVGGDWYWDNDNGEDKQLPYLKDRANRVLRDTDGESVCYWWERSPYRYFSYNFCIVSTSGNPYYDHGANYANGVCLGFAIRRRQNQE